MSKARVALLLVLVLAPLGVLPISTSDAVEAPARFARTYLVTGPAHLSISCAYGDIAVTAWNRKEISVRAVGPFNVLIRDSVLGSIITISVLQASRIGRLDFELRVPADTCIHLRNRKGNVSVSGLAGHVDVDSGDGIKRQRRAISGVHEQGGPALNLVTYDGRVRSTRNEFEILIMHGAAGRAGSEP